MIEIRCKKCNRFLGETDAMFSAKLKCSNCKTFQHYRIIPLSCYNLKQNSKPTKDVQK